MSTPWGESASEGQPDVAPSRRGPVAHADTHTSRVNSLPLREEPPQQHRPGKVGRVVHLEEHIVRERPHVPTGRVKEMYSGTGKTPLGIKEPGQGHADSVGVGASIDRHRLQAAQ